MKNISTYLLFRELVYDGCAGLENIPEPLSMKEIFDEIEKRYGINFGNNKKEWINWYLNVFDKASAQEKESIAMTIKILETEKKYISKINDE
ncbi:hypothetical protein [Aliikangiella sp. IMCC44359]|uniref:hypothetical protein n=1 Tax=Aliikangiella sp. IMCC44359 TaxID=3459125 RepID=UPI00403AA686